LCVALNSHILRLILAFDEHYTILKFSDVYQVTSQQSAHVHLAEDCCAIRASTPANVTTGHLQSDRSLATAPVSAAQARPAILRVNKEKPGLAKPPQADQSGRFLGRLGGRDRLGFDPADGSKENSTAPEGPSK
jgi:hypothetical protein